MKRRFAALAVAWICTLALDGCDVVDRFSGRAVQYNLEAEQVQDQGILLNIIRASKRRPLEFTSISTVTGTASASGNGGLTGPVGPHLPTSSHAFSLGLTVSGGPTFGLAVLDTQEFFSGISQPISSKLVDYYLKKGYPPNLLLNLLIGSIVITQGDTVATFDNDVTNPDKHHDFQTLLEYLLNFGLTTEQHATAKTYGPPLTPVEAKNMDWIAKAVAAGLDLKEVDWCGLSNDVRHATLARLPTHLRYTTLDDACKNIAKAQKDVDRQTAMQSLIASAGLPPVLYSLQKADSGVQFCFAESNYITAYTAASADQKIAPPADASLDAIACGKRKAVGNSTAQRFQGLLLPGLSKFWNETVDMNNETGGPTTTRKRDIKTAALRKNGPFDFAKPIDSLEMYSRSTEGVIYFLGEIARVELYPETEIKSYTPTVSWSSPPTSITHRYCNWPPPAELQSKKMGCDAIFRVERRVSPDDAFVAVDYDGASYALPSGNGQNDRTYQVLDLVSELIALNKSAKDLPATSVFTIIGSP